LASRIGVFQAFRSKHEYLPRRERMLSSAFPAQAPIFDETEIENVFGCDAICCGALGRDWHKADIPRLTAICLLSGAKRTCREGRKRFGLTQMTQCMVRPCVARELSSSWRMCGLASMYPASHWSALCSGPSWISARMRSHYRIGLNGSFGSPVFACAGKTDPPSRFLSSRRPRQVRGLTRSMRSDMASHGVASMRGSSARSERKPCRTATPRSSRKARI
jgi:hypothetical protein